MKVDMKGTLWLLVLCFYTFCQGYPNYHIGTGIFDITGPASEGMQMFVFMNAL